MAAPVVPVGSSAGAAASEPSTPARSKTLRPAEALRADGPAQQHSSSSPPWQPEQALSSQAAPAAVAPAPSPLPSPADITATLDHLAAAREALMPAEAALAIDHAEFGEVSIRFEQSREGQLSVELAAADPELQRAVTAAIGAERGLTTATEGDGSRAAGQASQRGPGTGGDHATGDGAQPRHDRDGAPRRGPAQSRTAAHTTDTHTGVFA